MVPLVEQLAATWSSIEKLCAGFGDDDWSRPTGCPGWTVQDQLSHLIDFESFALGRPRPEHTVADLTHTKNDMGAVNEVGVDARRALPGSAVLAEFSEVTAERLEQLRSLTDDALEREVPTPVGPGTLRDLLTLRVMDTWTHEQDIRRALDAPGHTDGPAVETAVHYLSQFLPFAVAKKAGAPEGSSVVIEVEDVATTSVVVENGRGRAIDDTIDHPTCRLSLDASTFVALVGGRTDARPEDVRIEGDQALGGRVAANLGFLP
jgi:uncharacterized protein (TIGR03083 family)